MELVLFVGKYVVLALIYLFVYLVYRGLIAQTLAERAEPRPARHAPSEVPIMKEPVPVRPGRPRPSGAGSRRPRSAAARPPAREANVSVQEALAEEPPAAAPEAAELQSPERPPIPELAPRLTVIHSECVEVPVGMEFPLLAAATIGRAEHNLVRLPDAYVSSQHALIFLKEGRRALRDRGSTNGTLLNGRALTEDVFLRDGDRITIGTTTLQYSEPKPAGR